MLTNYKKIIALVLFLSAAPVLFSQGGNEYCFHEVSKTGTSKFIIYLHKKYGVELSEKILLNVKAYEVTNDVFVLYKSDYQLISEKIQSLLSQSTDPETIERLKAKQSKIVLFDSIEDLVNH